eukprot:7390327-Prymnesium_polylepis.1
MVTLWLLGAVLSSSTAEGTAAERRGLLHTSRPPTPAAVRLRSWIVAPLSWLTAMTSGLATMSRNCAF